MLTMLTCLEIGLSTFFISANNCFGTNPYN